MRSASFLSAAFIVLLAAAGTMAQQMPRFRAGANLVRVDAYITADGVPIKDLSVEDFEVLEDGVPQRIESFQLVQPRGAAPVSELREPTTVAESREMARDPEARVFVIFMDVGSVQLEGSYRAQAPITTMLTRVIGQDDMIGVLTPDMAPRLMTLARRPESVEAIFRDHWDWGQRSRVNPADPRDAELRRCYGMRSDGLAAELIRRRQEQQTLHALNSLVVFLEEIREERKFVLVLTEGWRLGGPNLSLTRDSSPPGPAAVGIDPNGRLRMESTAADSSYDLCERERALLATVDLTRLFDDLIQRANRANVSFYPLDPRGLVAFDAPIGPDKPPPPSVDAAILRARYDALRTLAVNSDGLAILDSNATTRGIERMVQDTGAYYLLGYYSTNGNLDGKFRKLTVRVRRSGVDVRARPGYLAPTKAELAAALSPPAAAPAARPISTRRGTALRRGPATGLAYVASTEPRYRRTERLRFEVAVPAPDVVTARLLGRGGTPLNVPVATSARVDDVSKDTLVVADLTLAPLAPGEYELELTLGGQGEGEVVVYRFALIP